MASHAAALPVGLPLRVPSTGLPNAAHQVATASTWTCPALVLAWVATAPESGGVQSRSSLCPDGPCMICRVQGRRIVARVCWNGLPEEVLVTGVIGRNGQAARDPAPRGQGASADGMSDGPGQQAGAHASRGGTAVSGAGGVVVRPAPPPAGAPSPAGRGHVIVPRIGLQFTRRLSFDTWADIGRQLSVVLASSAWCLGDWLVYGQRVYQDRYREAVERTGLDYQTLRNYAWVARRFELTRRRDGLAFGHHAEVAALPEHEQDFWLRKAEQLGWSTSQLRREVRASLRERGDRPVTAAPAGLSGTSDPGQDGLDQPPANLQRIQVQLTPEQSQLCEQAASRLGLPLTCRCR
jgi:hypothetical protein